MATMPRLVSLLVFVVVLLSLVPSTISAPLPKRYEYADRVSALRGAGDVGGALKLARQFVDFAKTNRDPSDQASAFTVLASIYVFLGDDANAEKFYKKSIGVQTNEYARPVAAVALAGVYRRQGRLAEAISLYRETLAFLLAKRWLLDTTTPFAVKDFIKIAYRLGVKRPAEMEGYAREAFVYVQREKYAEFGVLLSRVAARHVTDDPAVVELMRERDDWIREWEKDGLRRRGALLHNLRRPLTQEEQALKSQSDRVQSALAEAEKKLKAKFPDFYAVTRAEPLTIEQAQASLREHEALVVVHHSPASEPMPEETFVWVVTKSEVRWVRSEVGITELSAVTSDLGCGLVTTWWDNLESASACEQQLGVAASKDGQGNVITETLPFDLARARGLYKLLFGAVEDTIRDKDLLVVSPGIFAQFPLHVLITDAPVSDTPLYRTRQVPRVGFEMIQIPTDSRSEELRKQYKIPGGVGVVVRPFPGGPAEVAGLLDEDVIISANSKNVPNVQFLYELINGSSPQSKMTFRIARNTRQIDRNGVERVEPRQFDVVVKMGTHTVFDWNAQIAPLDALRHTAWLTRKHPIAMLPSVASLDALRRIAKPSAATQPMIGFGNPLLDGDPRERPWEAAWAADARAKQRCENVAPLNVVVAARKTRTTARLAMRNGRVDVDHLRSQVPLPDTADELCTIGAALKLDAEDILLGANATETAIKRLSSDGKLANYRILHFATHGTLAGELQNATEPGLILTPPAEQTDIDDGYLSASDVATLKLDADWVIMSACNTAAMANNEEDALSGLAFAFFHAGARALLASHWAVDSAATVKLITTAVGAQGSDSRLGKARALQRAMLGMIDSGEVREAHPALWAPFSLFGEGASPDR